MMVAEFLPHQCEMGDEDTSLSLGPNVSKEVSEEGAKAEKGVPTPEPLSWREEKSSATEEKKGPWGGKAARQLVHLDISFETPSHTGLRTAELVWPQCGFRVCFCEFALLTFSLGRRVFPAILSPPPGL